MNKPYQHKLIHHKIKTPDRLWFTSDTHFGHGNILKYCPFTRPCGSVEEMDEMLIDRWNHRIGKMDTVFHLGDFSFYKNPAKNCGIIERLNGKIHLILGNHDQAVVNSSEVLSMFESVESVSVIVVEKRTVELQHKPLLTWEKRRYGAYHLHGHLHGEPQTEMVRRMDVGIDTRPSGDMSPWSFEELDKILSAIPNSGIG